MPRTTKEQLIRIAAAHFSQNGYAATTVRGIVKEADANIAAINYHFGSKEDLFVETLRLPLETLAAARAESLNASRDENSGSLTLTHVAEAFVGPLQFTEWPGGIVPFCKMLLRTFHESPELKGRIFSTYFASTQDRFLEALSQAAPDASQERIHLAFHFLLSTMIGSISGADRFPDATPIKPFGVNNKFLTDLVAFTAAGLEQTLRTP